MTAEEIIAAGIPIDGGDTLAALHAEAALDWMTENTTYTIDKENAETIKALPACAKLFVVKYAEVMRRSTGVTSQSIEGLSQSFDASGDISTTIWALANALLRGHLKSQVRVFTAQRRW